MQFKLPHPDVTDQEILYITKESYDLPPLSSAPQPYIKYYLGILSFAVVLFCYMIVQDYKRNKILRLYETGTLYLANGRTDPSSESGSDASSPQQIVKEAKIDQGRYGTVWLAKWGDRKVAVKEFPSFEKASWKWEKEIYETASIRHGNILDYIAAYEGSSLDGVETMQIITEYHELGSLFDYLGEYYLTPFMLHRLASTLIAGLDHLHLEIEGKPAIAHRDLKSLNILVSRNGECILADLGMAIKCDMNTNDKIQMKVGTVRYWAPEILANTLNINQLDEFKLADIYSVGLVFWEMCRRCITMVDLETTTCENYMEPYEDCVPRKPYLEDVYDTVVGKEIRPSLPERWKNDEILRVLSQIMQECWLPEPSARLTAASIKKTLSECSVHHDIHKYGLHLPITNRNY